MPAAASRSDPVGAARTERFGFTSQPVEPPRPNRLRAPAGLADPAAGERTILLAAQLPSRTMDLLIVGAGAMGRWFGDIVEADLAFADVDREAAEAAAASHGGRVVALDGEDTFDVVCLAVPMDAVRSAVAAQAPRATGALVDLSGVMADPVAAMAEHASDCERVSLHPLFAPENAPGRVAVVPDAPGPFTDRIRATLTDVGCTLFETTPEEHDRAMETVQARTHTAVLAFALAAEDVPDAFGTPIYDALEDIVADLTGGNPRVYADIQSTFEGATDVAEAAHALANADPETFESLYRDAGQ